MEYGVNVVPLLSGNISAGDVLHRCENRVWLVEDFEYVFIAILSPVIILQSEKHWGHILQLRTLPIFYDQNYWQFYLHRDVAQVKFSVLIRCLAIKEPQEDSEGLRHLHWLLMFWVMFPRSRHFQEAKSGDVFPNLGQFQRLRNRNFLLQMSIHPRKG